MRSFVLYWLTGKAEIVKGNNIGDAFNKAGYSSGALRALDFYDFCGKINYSWDKNPVNGLNRR